MLCRKRSSRSPEDDDTGKTRFRLGTRVWLDPAHPAVDLPALVPLFVLWLFLVSCCSSSYRPLVECVTQENPSNRRSKQKFLEAKLGWAYAVGQAGGCWRRI